MKITNNDLKKSRRKLHVILDLNKKIKEKTKKGNLFEDVKKALKSGYDSFLVIPEEVIKEAIDNGDLSIIDVHGDNVYYRMNHYENSVLVHIKDNRYVFVNETVYCEKEDKTINLVDELCKFSFCAGKTGRNRAHVMAGTPKELRDKGYTDIAYMPRIIKSLELYGEIKCLDTTYDIHHKGDVYDNRQGMTMYIPRKEHKDNHSHITGGIIKTYEKLKQQYSYMQYQFNRLHLVTEVA